MVKHGYCLCRDEIGENMIPKECKRLAEVDFPIAVVSKHSVREKSIRHGHPSTLHLWWARRPLAACRAMLLALLLPDPCDEYCPSDFKSKARALLPQVTGEVGFGDEDLRRSLLRFIGDFANWDNSSKPVYLHVGRELVKAAHGEEPPLVVDPFAGGGSIPLEALRLGCETFASDLNPVACLILKVMLEDIPRHGPKLADELRRVGKQIKEAAEKELAEFYPPDPDGAKPIAYLWARTVRCESPNCGAEIPLMRSFWLCKKANRKRALKYQVMRPDGEPPRVEFELFEPKTEKDVPGGTVTRAKASCLACGTVLPPERVRAQLSEQRGGADVVFDANGKRIGGARLLAVASLKTGMQGRYYRLPNEKDYEAVWRAMKRLGKVAAQKLPNGLSCAPDEPLPLMSGTFNAPLYGINCWADLFTSRQKLSLITFARQIANCDENDTKELLALVLSKLSELANSICAWEPFAECPRHIFGRQAIPIAWDFAEGVLTSDSSGSFEVSCNNVANGIPPAAVSPFGAFPQLADASDLPLPDETAAVWFTDPPYYFAVPYADLSDFFFVWLRRVLPGHPLLRDPFDPSNQLTPKEYELCEMAHWDRERYGYKDKAFFENGMQRIFGESRRILRDDGVGCVVFAHKTTEGWEALLSGMIQGGWVITSSWPIATEMGSRLRARDSAALATSVHLVCRPRPEDAVIGDWNDVLHGNKKKNLQGLSERVGDWMERLQGEGVRGADLVFACIGPALEIFSRYSKVETAEGREVKLAEYLEKVWEVVGRTALEQILGTVEARARNSAAGAVEEDARLTALFLWTLQSTNAEPENSNGDESSEDDSDEEDEAPQKKQKGFSLVFDIVRRFAQPLGIHLPDWEGRIIETKKGVVRLLSVTERAKQLFGEDGAQAVADRLDRDPLDTLQPMLFPELEKSAVPRVKGRGRGRRKKGTVEVSGDSLETRHEATTLDRVHAAMLLQASGRANALRALLKAEQDRSPDFLRLANALSALYPKVSEEKRLLDAMLLGVPR